MGMWRRCGIGLGLLAGVTASPAQAEWGQATSKHFVVYAEESEAEVREMARRLELFDATLRYLNKTTDDAANESNRVTIYVTYGVEGVQRLCGKGPGCAGVGGFYVPRVSGSVAFTPRREGSGLQPQIVLFHEYAHHFLLGSYQAAYPGWFSEGFAEFAATTIIDKDYVDIGRVAQHRVYGLTAGGGLTAAQMFATGAIKMTDSQRESLYGRGWLLTHYLLFDRARSGQLTTYLRLLNGGMPSPDAAKQAFGDLDALDRAVNAYMRRNSIAAARLPMDRLPPVSVAVRTLTPGETALIGFRMRSERGVNRASGIALYAEAMPVAARYPADATAQGWVAEMAYDAGNDDAAEAAADRALAADPASVQALLYKARVHLRRAEKAKATDPRVWTEARSWIVKANRVAPDDADVLASFYTGFSMQKVAPGRSAVAGLKRAVELVPQDPSLRYMAAGQYLAEKDLPAARAMLRPLAYDPHAGADNAAAKLIAQIDAGTIDAAAVTIRQQDDAD